MKLLTKPECGCYLYVYAPASKHPLLTYHFTSLIPGLHLGILSLTYLAKRTVSLLVRVERLPLPTLYPRNNNARFEEGVFLHEVSCPDRTLSCSLSPLLFLVEGAELVHLLHEFPRFIPIHHPL
jgi:hypothetical protein